ncbi:hypothetical protein BDA99DRAFT_543066 [Phascolomyces articulosus]|uniref:HCP-like protein n=1 Tax=Phascolomyces articulosus TaxID=60185 RepID=A0AAD5JXR2_9FUNG|nr:hypothetical protein BDA99DRAFT_543066 [Phascolomyces articulosus]
MGNSQSKQLHPTPGETSKLVASNKSTATATPLPRPHHNKRSRSPPHYQQQKQGDDSHPILKTEPPSSPCSSPSAKTKATTPTALSGCTTRHGTADPTMSSNYNDTTTSRPPRRSFSSSARPHHHHYPSSSSQRPIDESGYSVSQYSSALFSHATHTTSSSITTVSSMTSLSWGCVQEEEELMQSTLTTTRTSMDHNSSRPNSTTTTTIPLSSSPVSIVANNAITLVNADQRHVKQSQAPPPYYCYSHPEVDEEEDQLQHQQFMDRIGVSTQRVLQRLEKASSQERYHILEEAFARARLLEDPEDQAKAFEAALTWSEFQEDDRMAMDDDDTSKNVAAVWVARCHMDGFGTTKNPERGFAQLNTLATKHCCWDAFYPLAMCYLEGVKSVHGQVIQPVDKEMAFQWFSPVAQSQNTSKEALPMIALAQFRIGQCMMERDPEGAFQWFLKSADRNNVHAQYIVGVHFEFGIHVEKNLDKAKEYMLKSADQGFDHAQAALGILLINSKEYEQGIRWLERAAITDNPRALFRLGLMYEEGIGVEQDNDTAKRYFKAAADEGNAAAQFQLAIMYSFGRLGTRPNPQDANDYLYKSANAGYFRAQRHIGLTYLERGPHNQHHRNGSNKTAVQWFFRAASQGDIMAYILLGECYERGRGVQMDYRVAQEYYEKAISVPSSHLPKAQLALAEFLFKQNKTEEAYPLYYNSFQGAECIHRYKQPSPTQQQQEQPLLQNRSCTQCRAKLMVARYHLHGWSGIEINQGRAYTLFNELVQDNPQDYYAHYWLASCHLEGIDSVCKINLSTAFEHYMRSAELGYVEAEFQVGLMISNGTGVPETMDRTSAYEWYQKAAKKQYPPAYHNLGLWHYSIRDISRAEGYFHQAAKLGNIPAMERLASIYLKKAPAPVESLDASQRDLRNKAIRLLTRAADMNNAPAQRELGKLYKTEHQGVPQSNETAFDLFMNAAKQNDTEAKLLLGSCYENGKGVSINTERALALYLDAGHSGSSIASFAAGHLLHKLKRHQEAYKQYQIAAQDATLAGTVIGLTATLMRARYILSYIPVVNPMENDHPMPGDITKEQAFQIIQSLAIVEEFLPSFYYLGDCFQHGRGTPINLTQALLWFQRAVDEDQSVDALVQLAGIYDRGLGVPMDKTRAFELYRRAAEHQHPEGQHQLGLAHWHGLYGLAMSLIEATRWFTLSAAQGFGESFWALGQMAFDVRDHPLAQQHWERGKQVQHPRCIRSLAQLFLNNDNPIDPTPQTTELLQQAAELGDIDSLVALGRYHHSKATMASQQFNSLMASTPSSSIATISSSSSITTTSTSRMMMTGVQPSTDINNYNSNEIHSSTMDENIVLDDNASIDPDDDMSATLLQQQETELESATRCFEQAAQSGHVEAMFLAAELWHEQKQYAAAYAHFDQAANHGHLLARVMRARYLLSGGLGGVEANPEAAYNELMACAQMENGFDAYHSLGQCYQLGLGVQQDYQQAFEWYIRSVKYTRDAEALVCIGQLYADRYIPSPEQHADLEAMKWFNFACSLGNHVKANYRLGMYYLRGILNNNDTFPSTPLAVQDYLLEPCTESAIHHFHQAAIQQDREAMFYLSSLTLHTNPTSAIQWMDRAAQLGCRDALRELGKMYFTGSNTILGQNFERAFDLLSRATQLEDTDAFMLVGKFHEHGFYVTPDVEQAREWYELAIQAGHGSSAELSLGLSYHRSSFDLSDDYPPQDDFTQQLELQRKAYPLFRDASAHASTQEQRATPDIMIALYHLHGWGHVRVQEEQAMEALLSYARKGYARAYYQVARCYETGLGVQRNLSEAFHWYRQLEPFAHLNLYGSTFVEDIMNEELHHDVTRALTRLAEYHRHGWETKVDLDRANQLLHLAHERAL